MYFSALAPLAAVHIRDAGRNVSKANITLS
jgi:hypothetical protein